MRVPSRSSLAAVAVAALAAAAPGIGQAEAGRVVVMSVAGEGGLEYEDILVNALADDHTVLDSKDFDAAARRAGVDGFEPEDVAVVAAELDADIILDPLITRDRRKNVLTVRIRARDGRLWRRMTVTIAARKLGRGGIRAVRERLLAEIDSLLADDARDRRGRERDDRVVADRPARAERGRAPERRAADRPARVATVVSDDDDDPDYDLDLENPLGEAGAGRGDARAAAEPDGGDAEEEIRPRARASADPRRTPLVLDAGPAAISRNLSFSGDAFPQAPRGYHGAFVPGARVGGELYPIGFANPASAAAGIGVYGEYARVFKLTTRSTEAIDKPLPTGQEAWEVGLRLRYVFGQRASLPSLSLSVGYGRRAFVVDRTPLAGASLDLPDVDYELVTPGLSLRVPLGTPRFALTAGGRFLAVLNAGPIQSPNEYGAATLTGYDAEAGFDLVITRNLVLKARGQLSSLIYSFSGNGAQTRNRDMDPADQDVTGAEDRWLSGAATLGFAY